MNSTAARPEAKFEEAATTTPRWMQLSGAVVFLAVVVLLSFVLPPLFDSDADGSGGHLPPAGGHGGATG
jgi:hypothetical protein